MPEPSTEVVRREPVEIVQREAPGLVKPIAELAQIRDMFLAYQECVKALLTEDDYQQIGKKKFKKKSAWRKLGTAFGLSGEKIEANDDYGPDGRIRRAKRTVRATAPNGRSMDGEGVCDIFERCCEPGCEKRHDHCPAAKSEMCPGWVHFSHAEHDIPTTAYTRALNRAVSDLIGAGEVSAEEIVGEGEDGVPHRKHNGINGSGEKSDDGFPTITARFDGQCAGCSGQIKAGEKVVYDKANKRVWHPACASDGADVPPMSKDEDWNPQPAPATAPKATGKDAIPGVDPSAKPLLSAANDLALRLGLSPQEVANTATRIFKRTVASKDLPGLSDADAEKLGAELEARWKAEQGGEE
jgi:hypothetical protein